MAIDLKPITQPQYTDIKILLNKARSIEEIKRDIIDNFSKQKKLFTLKFSS